MKYAIIFEPCEGTELKPGDVIREVSTDIESTPGFGVVREIPKRMPCNVYNFETYTNGYAKGNNDVLDQLNGKFGDYDEKEDKL